MRHDILLMALAMLAAKSGVMCDIPAGERWGGFPARPQREWLRAAAELQRMMRGQERNRMQRRAAEDGGEE